MSAAPIPQMRLIRRAEYEKMVELGFFDNERVELLYGVITCMAPKGPPHDSALARLNERLVPAVSGRATVRVHCSFASLSPTSQSCRAETTEPPIRRRRSSSSKWPTAP